MTPPASPVPPENPLQEPKGGWKQHFGSKRRLRRKLGQVLSELIVALGFPRIKVLRGFRYPKEAFRRLREERGSRRVRVRRSRQYPEDGLLAPREERGSSGRLNWATARPFVLWATSFAATAAIALLLYGLLPHHRPVGSQRIAASLAVQAIEMLEGGDRGGALAVAQMMGQVKPPGHAAAYWGGFLKAAAPSAAAKAGAATGGRLSPVDRLVAQAGEQRGKRDAAGAVESLTKAVEQNPRDEALRLLRADAFMAAGRPSDALADSDQLVRRGFVTAGADVRSKAFLALNQPRRAIEEITRGLAESPNSTHLRLALADAYLRVGNPKRALEEARAVLAFEPASVGARAIAVDAMVAGGNVEAAEAMLRKTISIAPRDSLALNNLAWLLAESSGRPQEALGYAQRAYYTAAPNQPGIMDTLAWINHRLGRDDVALLLLRRAVALNPSYPDAKLHLGLVLQLTGHEAEGLGVLRELDASSVPWAVRDQARRALAAASPPAGQ